MKMAVLIIVMVKIFEARSSDEGPSSDSFSSIGKDLLLHGDDIAQGGRVNSRGLGLGVRVKG